jgi:CheY-like chemotaxis protein
MIERPSVLIVDDQVGDLVWLIDLIQNRGYEIVFATNEEAARERLGAIKIRDESYVLAIVDVMIAIKDLSKLTSLNKEFFESSRDTGIRLCRFARRELAISRGQLPIVCLTVRDDEDVRNAMKELDIPLFNRAPGGADGSIRGYIERHLPAQ